MITYTKRRRVNLFYFAEYPVACRGDEGESRTLRSSSTKRSEVLERSRVGYSASKNESYRTSSEIPRNLLRGGSFYHILSGFIAFTFSFTSVLPPAYAQLIPQALLNLPAPGAMVTPSAAFVPVLLKGMTIHPENPLQFDFIIDSGNTDFKEDRIKTESERLVKYFLASMTIPKDDLCVNLSPYESDKIIPDELGKTELGRDMLTQDYILKQLTASYVSGERAGQGILGQNLSEGQREVRDNRNSGKYL